MCKQAQGGVAGGANSQLEGWTCEEKVANLFWQNNFDLKIGLAIGLIFYNGLVRMGDRLQL